ncbi:MAG: SGNH/GDSL hydrolase family protein, partial [Candidatus Binatia bacterium]|nr:SGNH/GDSL hydrolase family protein [Candidatus Binatia bacterium]
MRSNITRWLSLLALMALLFFGLGEVLSRALNLVDRANGFPRKLFVAAPETGLSYRMRPGVDGTVRGVPVRTNQLGFRGPEVERLPGPAVRRVVILGDSVTFGFRMPETEIFPTLIAEQLAETTDAPWEILNFGVEGYNTVAELEVLRSTALDLRP